MCGQVPLSRCHTQPGISVLVIACHRPTIFVEYAEHILRVIITLLGGLLVPFPCFGIILWRTITAKVQVANIYLRLNVTLLSGLT